MTRAIALRPLPLLTLAATTMACGTTEPDPSGPLLHVSGLVTVNDTAAEAGRIQVVYLHPMLPSPQATASTGSDGRYEITIDLSDGLDEDGCRGSLVALLTDASLSLPMQSEGQRVAPHPLPEVCEGTVAGPDFALEFPPNIVPVDVSGRVTLGGVPTSATVRLVVASRRIWGTATIAETTTDAEGRYRIVTEVPDYYCDDLEFSTSPAGNVLAHPVSGCYTTTQDIELGG